jgi:hypothetical protein
VANQGIRAGFEADILAEGNYFVAGYPKPIDEFEGNYTAILARNNVNASNLTKNTAFTPPYNLTIANANDIVTPIKNCAGAKLTSINDCSSCGVTTTIDDKQQKTEITLFPNPFDTEFNLEFEGNFTYQITDLSGKIIEQGNGENQLDLGAGLNSGVYLLLIENQQNTYNSYILKR